MKKCSKCLLIKEESEFPQTRSLCKKCVSERSKEYYQRNKKEIIERVKKYTDTHKDSIKEYKDEYNRNNPNSEYHKEYRNRNKEVIREKRKEYYLKNKERIKQKVRNYISENKEYVNRRKKERRDQKKDYYNYLNRQYIKNKKETNPLFRLTCSIRSLISQSFKAKYTKKSKKTTEILGCSYEEFKVYIEKQFTEEMNWNNYSSYWELDHKTPISWAKDEQEVYDLNHYTNFQPLYWRDNISKGNKRTD